MTLKSPVNDYGVIIETKGAKTGQTLRLTPRGDLSAADLRVWRSDAVEQFVRLPDLPRKDGFFTFTLAPGSIHSLSTTRGQQKGAFADIPAAKPLSVPLSRRFRGLRGLLPKQRAPPPHRRHHRSFRARHAPRRRRPLPPPGRSPSADFPGPRMAAIHHSRRPGLDRLRSLRRHPARARRLRRRDGPGQPRRHRLRIHSQRPHRPNPRRRPLPSRRRARQARQEKSRGRRGVTTPHRGRQRRRRGGEKELAQPKLGSGQAGLLAGLAGAGEHALFR